MLYAYGPGGTKRALAAIPGGDLDPAAVPKYVTPMLIPPVMPRAGTITMRGGKPADYYEISVKQFAQQILPAPLPMTTVWGYGAVRSASKKGLLVHHAPSLTIESKWNRPVRVKWVNDLVDGNGDYLPHLLPVDQTLHWANPPGGSEGRDSRPSFEVTPGPYRGPVPLVTHVHGAAGVGDESDGYAEAWYLPAAGNIPGGYATEGTWYPFFAAKAPASSASPWGPGFATFQYPNNHRESTLWYHDHTLGHDPPQRVRGAGGVLPRPRWPGRREGDPRQPLRHPGRSARARADRGRPVPSRKTYYEIPIAIQDRSFNDDGSLFYPTAASSSTAPPRTSRVSSRTRTSRPIWNPEFFGNMIMVNGNTWPFQIVEQRRYRLRFLNGCQSRFLILDFGQIPGVEVWAIGNEGGFLAAPVNLTADHRQPAPHGTRGARRPHRRLHQRPGREPRPSQRRTGRALRWRRTRTRTSMPPTQPRPDRSCSSGSCPPSHRTRRHRRSSSCSHPSPRSRPATRTRPLALIEMMSQSWDGPAEALLGHLNQDGMPVHQMWEDAVTENPSVGDTEVWEFHNFTADAHPMHVHETSFEVVTGRPWSSTRMGRPSHRPGSWATHGRRKSGRAASRTRSSPTPAR